MYIEFVYGLYIEWLDGIPEIELRIEQSAALHLFSDENEDLKDYIANSGHLFFNRFFNGDDKKHAFSLRGNTYGHKGCGRIEKRGDFTSIFFQIHPCFENLHEILFTLRITLRLLSRHIKHEDYNRSRTAYTQLAEIELECGGAGGYRVHGYQMPEWKRELSSTNTIQVESEMVRIADIFKVEHIKCDCIISESKLDNKESSVFKLILDDKEKERNVCSSISSVNKHKYNVFNSHGLETPEELLVAFCGIIRMIQIVGKKRF